METQEPAAPTVGRMTPAQRNRLAKAGRDYAAAVDKARKARDTKTAPLDKAYNAAVEAAEAAYDAVVAAVTLELVTPND